MRLRLTQIAPGVHRLASVYTNWYLLEAGGRLTVLDAGLPGDWGDFSSALSRLGHTVTDIDAVLITHHHPDHAGNAERLRSSGARVLSHPADSPYLRGEKHLGRGGLARFLWRPWYAFYMLGYVAKGITERHRSRRSTSWPTRKSWMSPGLPESSTPRAIRQAAARCSSRIARSCSAAMLS